MNKLIIFVLLFIGLMLSGTLGYMVLENTGFWTGMYLTIITVFTVGYGDIVPIHPSGKIFTVILTVTSVSFVAYAFSKITENMIEGELKSFFMRKKMNKQVAGLANHYIVCGFGRIGQEICKILHEHNCAFVAVDNNPEKIRSINELDYLELEGEASDDQVLFDAGIERAKGLVTVVSSDADNLYVTLTARELNPDLYIMARSSGVPGAGKKLLRAGASEVISPYSIGAHRMAHMILHPTVQNFIDLATRSSELGLCMEELLVTPEAQVADTRLMDSGIRQNYDLIVVSIKREAGDMIFNPRPDTLILSGDTLVVLGKETDVIELQAVL